VTSRVIIPPTVTAGKQRFVDGAGLFAVFAGTFQHRLLVTRTLLLGAYRRCHSLLVVVHGHQIRALDKCEMNKRV
jgi:hypothetical protein